MEHKLRIQEFPESAQKTLKRAMCHDEGLAIIENGKPVAWVVGEGDLLTLRDCDRIKRRIEDRHMVLAHERAENLHSALDEIRGIGPILHDRLFNRLKG